MLSDDLRAILGGIGITQAEFARLVGVTPRAVSLWMVGDRAIPGPVEAYARLLQTLTPAQRQVEIAKLTKRSTGMRDGMYGIEFSSTISRGLGVLILDNGRVYGADEAGVKYDGDYVFDEAKKLAELRLKVTYPPNVRAVFGVSHPYEWSIDLTTNFNPHADIGQVSLATPLGPRINANYRFLRALPEM
jgi:transcriptional regulator with XRE-family HTH domain